MSTCGGQRKELSIEEMVKLILEKDNAPVIAEIEAGFDIESKKSDDYFTVLHAACFVGNLLLVSVIIGKGANVDVKNKWVRGSLHLELILVRFEICLPTAGRNSINHSFACRSYWRSKSTSSCQSRPLA